MFTKEPQSCFLTLGTLIFLVLSRKETSLFVYCRGSQSKYHSSLKSRRHKDYFLVTFAKRLENLFHPLLVFSRPWTSPSYSLHSPAPNLMGIENKSQMQQVGNIFWTDQSILASTTHPGSNSPFLTTLT